MRLASFRRPVALAGATVMAGATLTFVGSGVAAAEPVQAVFDPPDTSKIIRTVSNGTPEQGETVTIRSQIERSGGIWTVYTYTDYTPTCFMYVPGTARWQASGGDIADETTKPNEFSFNANQIRFHVGGLIGVTPTFWIEADYTVTCGPGNVATGGADYVWTPTGSVDGNRTMGPNITVQAQAPNPGNPGPPIDIEEGSGSLDQAGDAVGSIMDLFEGGEGAGGEGSLDLGSVTGMSEGGEGTGGEGSLDVGSVTGMSENGEGTGGEGGEGSLDLGSLLGGAADGEGGFGSEGGDVNVGSLVIGSLMAGGALALFGGDNNR